MVQEEGRHAVQGFGSRFSGKQHCDRIEASACVVHFIRFSVAYPTITSIQPLNPKA